MDQDQLNRFLAKVAQIESAGGKYIQHKTMKSGIHKGSAAIGKYGFMPNTVQDVINRQQRSGEITPEILALKKLTGQQLKLQLESNPELQENLAQTLAKHVLNRQAGDEQRAAYSWNMGHNLTPDRIPEEKLQRHQYVQKFNKLKNMVPIAKTAQNINNPKYEDSLPINEFE